MTADKKNVFVLCCCCGDYFPSNKTYFLNIRAENIENIAHLNICKECYKQIPETQEKGNNKE
jgi:hypothetical protein